jgi:ABC-type antimicrobial peptide transport system permease subunit
MPPPTLRELHAALARVDPGVAIDEVRSVEQLFAETLVPRRDAALAASFFASTGLLLAALGLFALVAESILRRRRELAVRLALGATHRGIVSTTVAESLRLAAAGLVPGLLAALAALRFLAAELDAPDLAGAHSILAFAAAAAAVTVAAAALAAAVRLLRLEPSAALRAE